MKIIHEHPEWTKKTTKVMSRLVLDYSNPTSWNIEMLTMGRINIKTCWDKGRIDLESFIQGIKFPEKLANFDFFDLVLQGITMLKPFRKKIGLTELEAHTSVGDVDKAIAAEAELNNVELEINALFVQYSSVIIEIMPR